MQVLDKDNAFYDNIIDEVYCIDEVPESDYKGILTGYKIFDTREAHDVLPGYYCKVWRCDMTWSDMSGVINAGKLREAVSVKRMVEIWQ